MQPFYDPDIQRCYRRLRRGRDAIDFSKYSYLSREARELVFALLDPCPQTRLGCGEELGDVKAHAFYAKAGLDWVALLDMKIKPEFVPPEGKANVDREFVEDDPRDSALLSQYEQAKKLAEVGVEPVGQPNRVLPRPASHFDGFNFRADTRDFVATGQTPKAVAGGPGGAPVRFTFSGLAGSC